MNRIHLSSAAIAIGLFSAFLSPGSAQASKKFYCQGAEGEKKYCPMDIFVDFNEDTLVYATCTDGTVIESETYGKSVNLVGEKTDEPCSAVPSNASEAKCAFINDYHKSSTLDGQLSCQF